MEWPFMAFLMFLKNVLYKTAQKQPGIIAKIVAAHIFS